MDWDKATDIMVATAIATSIIFFVMGVTQWFKRKSFKKIDKPLLALIVPYVLVAITYIVFDYIFILNTRPDGSGEASFPSTHTLITTTFFLCAAIAIPYYVKQKSIIALLDVIMLASIILVPVGRVLANKHWVSDCIGALIFSVIFAGIYLIIVKKICKKGAKNE